MFFIVKTFYHVCGGTVSSTTSVSLQVTSIFIITSLGCDFSLLTPLKFDENVKDIVYIGNKAYCKILI